MLSTKILTSVGETGDVLPWYFNESSLATSLVAYWRLNETSGNRADSIGSSTLTDVNTVTSNTGLVQPLAAEFVIANTEYLSAADSATLSAGNIDMWGSMWVYPSSITAVTSCIAGKFNTSANREWQIAQVNSDVVFQVSPDGTSAGNGAITASGVLTANTWTFIMWYHDSVNNLLGLSIDGRAFSTSAHTTGIFNSLAAFNIGRQGTATAYFGGRISSVALGKNYVPSIADAVFLYNNKVANGVKSVNFLCMGGEVDWSADGTRLVFDRKDGNGIYQLHLIDPDGSNEVCISDPAVVGGPSVDKHKGFPAWHPSGDYIVAQVEMETHNGAQSLSEPGRGHQCDVWILTPDGQTWWKMTNYSGVTVSGVLNPRFSPDGTKLLWAQKIGGVSSPTAPFGVWNLQLADFAIVSGTPTLSNITTLTPGNGTFYESQGFNRDSTKILFTSDAGLANPYGLDVFMYTISDTTLVNLSNSATHWDEHMAHAPHTEKVAFMSTNMYSTYNADDVPTIGLTELKSETIVTNTDGSNSRQLTHFNTSGFNEYNAEHSVATVVSWHPNGRRLAVAQLLVGATYDLTAGRKIWIVNFNGIYG